MLQWQDTAMGLYMFKSTNTWVLHVYMQGHIKMLKCKEKAGCMLKNKETTVKTNDTRVFNPKF